MKRDTFMYKRNIITYGDTLCSRIPDISVTINVKITNCINIIHIS